MLGCPCGNGCNGVCFPAHDEWSSRDVSMAGMCDCVKECVFYNVIDHLVCWLGIFYNGCISHIVEHELIFHVCLLSGDLFKANPFYSYFCVNKINLSKYFVCLYVRVYY